MDRNPAEGRHGLFGRLRRAAPACAGSLFLASGKGGTGKSVIAAALAYRFAETGLRSVVFDADFGVGNAHILQGLTADLSVAHVVAGRIELEDVAAIAPTGVRVIPGGSGVSGLGALSSVELRLIARGMRWVEREADRIVVDGPAGVSDQALLLGGCADLTVVVTTPDVTAMTDAYAWIKLASARRRDTPLVLLVNRAREEGQATAVAERIRGVARRFLGLEVPFAGWIVEDPAVAESVARRRPFSLSHPHAAATAALVRIAVGIEERIEAGGLGGGSFAERLEGAVNSQEQAVAPPRPGVMA